MKDVKVVNTSDGNSGEAGSGGVHNSYETHILGESVPVGQGKYLLDGLADTTNTNPLTDLIFKHLPLLIAHRILSPSREMTLYI